MGCPSQLRFMARMHPQHGAPSSLAHWRGQRVVRLEVVLRLVVGRLPVLVDVDHAVKAGLEAAEVPALLASRPRFLRNARSSPSEQDNWNLPVRRRNSSSRRHRVGHVPPSPRPISSGPRQRLPARASPAGQSARPWTAAERSPLRSRWGREVRCTWPVLGQDPCRSIAAPRQPAGRTDSDRKTDRPAADLRSPAVRGLQDGRSRPGHVSRHLSACRRGPCSHRGEQPRHRRADGFATVLRSDRGLPHECWSALVRPGPVTLGAGGLDPVRPLGGNHDGRRPDQRETAQWRSDYGPAGTGSIGFSSSTTAPGGGIGSPGTNGDRLSARSHPRTALERHHASILRVKRAGSLLLVR